MEPNKCLRLIYYLDLVKCWTIPKKYILKVFFTVRISELYGQKLYNFLEHAFLRHEVGEGRCN
jgi:hypothetical protein